MFGNDGKPMRVDGVAISESDGNLFSNYNKKPKNLEKLRTSESLEFLKEDEGIGNISAKEYWNLYGWNEEEKKEIRLEPLKFSNGKSQEDVVKEIVNLQSHGHKIIFLQGTCGSGKSAIALNIARLLGRASIVVPVKALQRQYEEDYITKKFLRKPDGKKVKIAMITGKDNHDSIIQPGIPCSGPNLPENIRITEKNFMQIKNYVRENPFIDNPNSLDLEDIKRITIAASNPYWSPIVPSNYELKILEDATIRKYKGANGDEYKFYHRKKGCSYYDQYLAYIDADITVFNSAKYRAEMSIGRKPLTDVDIIDEADDFLDSLFQQDELNITHLLSSLKIFYPSEKSSIDSIEKIKRLLELEEKEHSIKGIRKEQVFHISDTRLKEIFEEFNKNAELASEIILEEMSYANKALEIAKNFEKSLNNVYLTLRKDEKNNLLVNLVSTDISGKFQELVNKTKTLVLMSGTMHSENIIKNIFGIKDFKIVKAEELNFGSIEIIKTGKEIDCKYSNFTSNRHSREDYLLALHECLKKSELPVLVHVHSFRDLPDEREKLSLDLNKLISSESIKDIQMGDKTGSQISEFKKGIRDSLFSTKCSRGVDFPGETCNSIVFTKYPNPNVADTFWQVLNKTHPNYYWEFYKDMAWRGFLQRIYRALRSPADKVKILSPDERVLNAVRKLQEGFNGK